jgi:hypothetical protein
VACGTSEPALTDATSLTCPTPGALPFRLMSSGFHSADNKTLAMVDTRFKDEASDTLGVPSGVQANDYLADTASPAAGAIGYHGVKARTTSGEGGTSSPLPGENVSLWFYDGSGSDDGAWEQLARGQTGDDGSYDLTADPDVTPPNGAPVYSMLEADGTCSEHQAYLLPTGSKFVVVDIDGTLTTSDGELIKQVTDGSYVPMMMTAANAMTQAWATKGYPVVYLTARPHVFDEDTRVWLATQGFADGPLILENEGAGSADVYKTRWLQRMATDFGWVPFAAYGNAITDIEAYANVSIALDHTFIIGPEGGSGGTVAIPNMDYTQHITDFVDMQPDNH